MRISRNNDGTFMLTVSVGEFITLSRVVTTLIREFDSVDTFADDLKESDLIALEDEFMRAP